MTTITRIAIGILLIAGSLQSIACSGEEKYEKPLTPVRVKEVENYYPGGATGAGERYSASILPSMQIELAFKNGGYITGIHRVRGANNVIRHVQEGDSVPKGTLLASVRAEDYTAKVQQAESQLKEAQSAIEANAAQMSEAEAALGQTKRDLDRATKLLESKSLTRPEFEGAKTKVDMAQAKVEAVAAQKKMLQAKMGGAQALVDEAKLAESDASLRAPMDCYILKRLIEPGTLVGPGRPVFVIAERNTVKAVFGVPDTTVKNVRPGTWLTMSTEALPGIDFSGWISRISPSADPNSRVFEIQVTIPRAPAQLRLGMIATVTLPADKAAVPLTVVPINAIVRLKESSEDYAVNIVTEKDGKQFARQRPVKLGEAFGNMIAITSGVSLGDRVIVSGSSMIVNNDQVRIIP